MNISLEQIIQNLKINKVNIIINKNKFNELETYKNLNQYNDFDNYINLIGKFKDIKFSKNNLSSKFYKEEENINIDNLELSYEDNLILCFATYLDESISLFDKEKIKEYLRDFKKTLIENLDNYNKAYKNSNFKKYKYSLEDVKKALEKITEENCIIFLIYISNILKTNIIYKNILINNNFDKNIELVQTNNKFEIILKDNNYIVKYLLNKYNNINIKELLLNDIKELSKNLNLEITTNDKNTNKKRNLNKQELINNILVFIEAHK